MRPRPDRHRTVERDYWAAVGVAPTESFVHLPGSGTRVRVQAVGAGDPVLFVHGGSTSGTGWAPLAARLPGFRCLLVDRPGCGMSDAVATPMRRMDAFEPFADDLVAHLLDALAVDRAHVVATSFGGYFALRGAAAHPDRVRRLALVGFPVGAPASATPLAMRMTAVPGLGAAMVRLPVGAGMARRMLRQLGLGDALDDGRLPDEGMAWFRSLLNDTPTMRNELASMPPLMHPRAGLSPDLVLDDALLARVRAPTILVWGDHDPLGGGDVARRFAAKLGDSRLEVWPGVGHVPWLDRPDDVADEVTSWLSG